MNGQLIHGSSKPGGAKSALAALSRFPVYIWASPASLIGLGAAALALTSGGTAHVVDGVLEVEGGLVRWILKRCTPLRGGASAMTLGHVVIARDRKLLEMTRIHERVHVRQCERWGPLFIPAYFAASGLAWWRGQRPYYDNHFEREAYAREG
ncbi:MAG TPA: hypothetical protein VF669_11510 [Tepidisphaeraceae bacterium]|jgi:hypothetical protein